MFERRASIIFLKYSRRVSCLRLKCAALAVQPASKLALRLLATSFRSTLHTAERLVAASEEGTRDVALQQREQRSERLEGPCAGRFCSFLGLKKEIREFRLNKE